MEIFIGLFVIWIIWMIISQVKKNKAVDTILFQNVERSLNSGKFDEEIYQAHNSGLTDQEIADDILQGLINLLVNTGKLDKTTLRDSEFQSKYRMSVSIAKNSIRSRLNHIIGG